MPKAPRKRRTREHVIADLSVNFVERQVLLCGYSVERVFHDYGYDLVLFTYNAKGEVENGCVFLQVKATDRLRVLSRQQAIPFRVTQSDLRHWLNEDMPVILIVYDAQADVAYWLHLRSHLASEASGYILKARGTTTVYLPLANRLDPAAVRSIAQLKTAAL
jgi:hypothetical protein